MCCRWREVILVGATHPTRGKGADGPFVSERLIAEALHPYPDDLVIATKGGLTRSGPNQWSADGRPQHVRAACDEGLQRLQPEQNPSVPAAPGRLGGPARGFVGHARDAQ